jgi:hypothetical protein
MSLGKMISEKRDRQRRVIEVPEWGDDDAPLLIYSSAITAGDLNKIQKKHKNFLNDMTIDGMVDLIIMKAQDVDGNKLFTLEDKIYLMGEEMSVIATVAGQMFNDIDTIEDAEKN